MFPNLRISNLLAHFQIFIPSEEHKMLQVHFLHAKKLNSSNLIMIIFFPKVGKKYLFHICLDCHIEKTSSTDMKNVPTYTCSETLGSNIFTTMYASE